jgi:hypothetical protein
VLALLNELGRDGWQLTISTVLDTALVGTNYGWTDSAVPVRVRYILMREVPG